MLTLCVPGGFGRDEQEHLRLMNLGLNLRPRGLRQGLVGGVHPRSDTELSKTAGEILDDVFVRARVADEHVVLHCVLIRLTRGSAMVPSPIKIENVSGIDS